MIDNPEETLRAITRLEGNKVILRRFREDDAAAVLAYGSDAETLRFLIWGGANSLEEAEAAVRDVLMPHMGVFAVTRPGDDTCIGCIDVRPDFPDEKAGFGYVLSREHWGKGYMTEALFLLMEVMFETLELSRMESHHFAGNDASGKVMTNCGLLREGCAPRWVKVKGVFQDVVHYGVLREQWLSAKANGSIRPS